MAKRFQGEWAASPPFTHKVYNPAALALGQLALAWNDLHELLSLVFCSIMGGGYVGHFLAIWHALKVDRAQRDILLGATRSRVAPIYQSQTIDWRRNIINDIEWLCGKADKLEDARNDALHSPFWATKENDGKTTVIAVTGLGHVRARKFQGKDVLSELRWCRDATTVLRNFAMEIEHALKDYKRPWPDRPKLPIHGRPNAKKPPRQVRKAKHPPRPQSSKPSS